MPVGFNLHDAAGLCSWAVPAPARRCNCPRPKPQALVGFAHRDAVHVPKALLRRKSSRELVTPAESIYSSNKPAIMLAAASLAASMLFGAAPMAAVALESAEPCGNALQETQQQVQVQSPAPPSALPSSVLPPPEAPALVSDSGEVLMEGVKGAVAGGLQGMAASSMTAVGGPVAGEAVAAGLNPTSSTPAQPGQAEAAAEAAASLSAPVVSAASSSGMGSPAAASQAECMLLNGVWQAYCHSLETSPLQTKICTGIVGTLLGDFAAQILSYHQAAKSSSGGGSSGGGSSGGGSSGGGSSNGTSKRKAGFTFDVVRCGRLCLYSAAIGTPMGHYEYAFLEAWVMPGTPTAPAAVAAKVCLDQLVQTPFGMALFFAVMKMLEGRPAEAKQEVQTKLLPGLLANWRLWPAAQLINFTVIPPEQRILFGNIVGVCWTCIISNMQQSSSKGSRAESCSSAASPGAVPAPAAVLPQPNRPGTPMPA